MRQFFCFCVLVCSICLSSCSDNSKPVTQPKSDLRNEYENRKITLQSTQGAPPSSKYWGVTQGFEPINEPTFLKLAGYDKEAGDSARNMFLKDTFIYGGCALMVGGLGYLFYNAVYNTRNISSASTLIPYAAMMGGGIISLEIGALVFTPNITPLGRAEQITRDYNDALIGEIKNAAN